MPLFQHDVDVCPGLVDVILDRDQSVVQRDQVDKRSGNREQKSEQEPLRYLSPCEAEGFHEVGIKNWEAIKKNSDHEKKIQEGRSDNPPAIVDAICGTVRLAERHPSPERRPVSRRMRSLSRLAG